MQIVVITVFLDLDLKFMCYTIGEVLGLINMKKLQKLRTEATSINS
jgi:hypothetical protein